MLLYEVVLLLVIAAGWLAGRWLLHSYRGRTRADGTRDDAGSAAEDTTSAAEGLGDTIGFVGGAFGILLGLLLVFTVGHYVEARQVSKDEAATAAAMFYAVSPFEDSVRDPLRHDIVCYMTSVSTQDWAAVGAGDLTGSENAAAYAARVQAQIEALPQGEEVQSTNQYLATEEFLDLAKYRQLRLLHAVPEVPLVIWVVLYASTFLFVALTVFRLGDRRWLTRLAVGATTLLLVASVGALIQLDAPYRGLGTALRPVAMEAALSRLRDTNPEPASIWAPCEPLAEETR